MQQDEFVVILLIGEATGGIRQVVVVGNDQMFAVDHIHIFDGHEGEGELAVLAATLGDALRIVDVHQVDMTDLLDEAFGINIGQTDLVDTHITVQFELVSGLEKYLLPASSYF